MSEFQDSQDYTVKLFQKENVLCIEIIWVSMNREEWFLNAVCPESCFEARGSNLNEDTEPGPSQ